MIALCLSLVALIALLLLRPPPPALRSRPPPRSPRPLAARRVSFSVVSSGPPFSLPSTPAPSLPIQRRSSFRRRASSASADQFGCLSPPSPASPKSPGRLRWSLPSRRTSSSLIYLGHPDPSPSPPRRTKFTNPFSKHSRSRASSLPITFNSSDQSSNSPGVPLASSPSAGRRTLAKKLKSIFKLTPSEPTTQFKLVPKTIDTRLHRKPVPRTQPYGPPWNASIPISNSSSRHPSLEHPEPTSTFGERSQGSFSRRTSISPGQPFSPTFLNELDEKLLLLEQQRIRYTKT